MVGRIRVETSVIRVKPLCKRNPQHVEYDEDVLLYSMFREKRKVRFYNSDPTLLEWLEENLEKSKVEQEKYSAARLGVRSRMAEIKEMLKLRDLTWCSVWGLPIQEWTCKYYS